MQEDMTLGSAISEARKKKKLSQKQLADLLKISPQYLNDIERDRRNPSSDEMISQLASNLDLKSDYLHYLNGRFPEAERNAKVDPKQFEKALTAFRKTLVKK